MATPCLGTNQAGGVCSAVPGPDGYCMWHSPAPGHRPVVTDRERMPHLGLGTRAVSRYWALVPEMADCRKLPRFGTTGSYSPSWLRIPSPLAGHAVAPHMVARRSEGSDVAYPHTRVEPTSVAHYKRLS